jgi:hypothetical protein
MKIKLHLDISEVIFVNCAKHGKTVLNAAQMSHEESKAVKEMSIGLFIALFHSEAFLKSGLSTISSAVGMKYLSLMQLYKQENLAAATVAIKSVHNHL